MNWKRLNKVKRELAGMRQGRHKALEFQSLARRLGRDENTKRGKEPMWESIPFPDLFPLAIPKHGGKDISPGVQRQLLNLLEEDVLRWEEKLDLEDGDGSVGEADPGEDDESE
jgi:hypothetical protein